MPDTFLLDPGDPAGADFTTAASAFAALHTGDTLLIADGAQVSGADLQAGGVAATGVTVRWRDGLVPVSWAGAAGVHAFRYYHDWTIQGIHFTACTRDALFPLSGTPDGLTVEDCSAYATGGIVSGMGDGFRLERLIGRLLTIASGSSGGAVANGFSVDGEIRAVLLAGCAGRLAVGAAGLVEHVTLADGVITSGVAVSAGSGVARNVIVFRPGVVSAGLLAGDYSGCLVFEPTTGVQFDGSALGVAPAGDNLIADPLFYDLAGLDYRLGGTSPALGTGDLTADTVLDVERIAWAAVPRPRSRGAFASVPITLIRVIPKGSHAVRVIVAPNWETDAAEPDNWAVTGATPVRVARVEVSAGELTVTTDRPMAEGEAYALAPLVPGVHSGDIFEPFAFEGIRVSRPTVHDPRAILEDFAAAPFGADGRPGGGLTYTAGGDYKLEGGLPTIERMIWARVLTNRGELPLHPERGSGIKRKAPAPPNIRDEERRIALQLEDLRPYVVASAVALRYDGDHLEVRIVAQTSVGRLDIIRRVSAVGGGA